MQVFAFHQRLCGFGVHMYYFIPFPPDPPGAHQSILCSIPDLAPAFPRVYRETLLALYLLKLAGQVPDPLQPDNSPLPLIAVGLHQYVS